MPERVVLQYVRRVWTIVVLRMLIDVAAASFILAVIVLVAAGLVELVGSGLGVNLRHLRHTAGILGSVYVFVIWARTLRRHWIIAGQIMDGKPTAESQVPEARDAQPATPSN
jgi:hypothetical protein